MRMDALWHFWKIALIFTALTLAACGGSGSSGSSGSSSNSSLPSVTGVTATGGDKEVTISWPAVSGATSYNIYWSSLSGVSTTNGTKIGGATSPYVHTGLAAGTAYYYIVAAVNSTGEGAPSTQATATTSPAPAPIALAAPTGVTASGGVNQVTISWPAVSGATSYNIYWTTTAGVTTFNGMKIAGAASPYVHLGRTASTSYYYIVTAVNSVGESAASAQVSATTTTFDGATFYTANCSNCHGSLATSEKRGATAAQIQAGIDRNYGGMGKFSYLTSDQVQAISTALQ